MGARFYEGPAVRAREDGGVEVVERALHGFVLMSPTMRLAAHAWAPLPPDAGPLDLIRVHHRLQRDLVEQFTRNGLGKQG